MDSVEISFQESRWLQSIFIGSVLSNGDRHILLVHVIPEILTSTSLLSITSEDVEILADIMGTKQ